MRFSTKYACAKIKFSHPEFGFGHEGRHSEGILIKINNSSWGQEEGYFMGIWYILLKIHFITF